jgi:hypothetical protein
MFLFLLGSTPEEEDVSGTITVPEVAHDTEEDEYVVRRPLTHDNLKPKLYSRSPLTVL